jgi:hypothetical protein
MTESLGRDAAGSDPKAVVGSVIASAPKRTCIVPMEMIGFLQGIGGSNKDVGQRHCGEVEIGQHPRTCDKASHLADYSQRRTRAL